MLLKYNILITINEKRKKLQNKLSSKNVPTPPKLSKYSCLFMHAMLVATNPSMYDSIEKQTIVI